MLSVKKSNFVAARSNPIEQEWALIHYFRHRWKARLWPNLKEFLKALARNAIHEPSFKIERPWISELDPRALIWIGKESFKRKQD